MGRAVLSGSASRTVLGGARRTRTSSTSNSCCAALYSAASRSSWSVIGLSSACRSRTCSAAFATGTQIRKNANEAAPPQTADAPPAARVREAGCIVLGKTTMPDYGMLSSGLSSLHGVTRNPWQLDRNTSGSSSGAAAAAVARYAPLHLGTDIGGSVRLPATHCGIFALKPSLGRVPVHPPYMGRVAGPMTRTVEDAALLMNVISRPDARDFMSLPFEGRDFAAGLHELEPRRLKIGFLADMGVGLAVHPEVRAAAESAASALAGAGCAVESIRSFLTAEMLDGMCRF